MPASVTGVATPRRGTVVAVLGDEVIVVGRAVVADVAVLGDGLVVDVVLRASSEARWSSSPSSDSIQAATAATNRPARMVSSIGSQSRRLRVVALLLAARSPRGFRRVSTRHTWSRNDLPRRASPHTTCIALHHPASDGDVTPEDTGMANEDLLQVQVDGERLRRFDEEVCSV